MSTSNQGRAEDLDESLWGPPDLSAYLQVPVATLYAWHHRQIGPKALKVGRHLRYRREDVVAWLAQQG